jgi:5-formyltetrahydrofolate cyclo-ligase
MLHNAKHALRRKIQASRLAMPPAARNEASVALCQALLASPTLEQVSFVALFWPMIERGELDLRALDQSLRARGTTLYYPFMRGDDYGFARVAGPSDLEVTSWGFCQPKVACSVAAPGELELIVAPALALTSHGQRLGYGVGFYDRVVPQVRAALLIGTCYRHELLDELPAEAHDQRVDCVATDAGVVAVE